MEMQMVVQSVNEMNELSRDCLCCVVVVSLNHKTAKLKYSMKERALVQKEKDFEI